GAKALRRDSIPIIKRIALEFFKETTELLGNALVVELRPAARLIGLLCRFGLRARLDANHGGQHTLDHVPVGSQFLGYRGGDGRIGLPEKQRLSDKRAAKTAEYEATYCKNQSRHCL